MNSIVLGDVAERLAVQRITGEKSDANFKEMLKYYPENNHDEFKNCWCAAFVFHCCRKSGMNLPFGTNKTMQKGNFRRFASVIAWVEWAQVLGFLHETKNFTPQRSDIVIYNNIIPVEYKEHDSLWCDHIGIVLSFDNDTLVVAEGNVDNQNISGIVKRQCNETIGCYIRIPEHNIYDDWQIDSDKLSFRTMRDTAEDKAQLLEWLSNPTVTDLAWGDHAPWDMQKLEEHFIAKLKENSSVTPCFIEANGEPIGYIQYYPIEEDSYLFKPPVSYDSFKDGYGMDLMIGYPGLWSKGIGSKVIRMMTDFLIHSKGAKLVCADPEEGNHRSVKCWRKAGFVPVGIVPNFDDPERQSVFMVYRNNENE
ncbi:MAG: hypothetical protein BGN88_05905 [Clostridiales bacterium 43-6]|nr:MAG: hypothetical protein BGN88_05905 [Clostridiales bacterium 43-6]